jgi:molecular chaperone DnaJ
MDDIFSMFGDIFGGGFGSGFGGFGSQRQGQRRPVFKGKDQRLRVELELNEIVNGTTKKFKLKNDITCSHCHGTGSEDGKTETCQTCHGSGYVIRTQQSIFGMMQSQSVCPQCNGEGNVIKNKCHKCHGEGITKGETIVEVNFPPGLTEGMILTLEGKGVLANLMV